MSNIVNFTLLVSGYFNISTNIRELYFAKQLNYLKIVNFLCLAFKIYYVGPECVQEMVNIPH